jgi:hypothetical protein
LASVSKGLPCGSNRASLGIGQIDYEQRIPSGDGDLDKPEEFAQVRDEDCVED